MSHIPSVEVDQLIVFSSQKGSGGKSFFYQGGGCILQQPKRFMVVDLFVKVKVGLRDSESEGSGAALSKHLESGAPSDHVEISPFVSVELLVCLKAVDLRQL